MKIKGLTLAEWVVVVLVVLLLIGVLIPGLYRSRRTAIRLFCRTNLEGIGRAMTTFASDNAGRYPRAGGEGSSWIPEGVIYYWYAPTEAEAFRIVYDDYGQVETPGQATITSSFYLLVKYSLAKPKQFVCKGDAGAVEWRINEDPMAPYVGMDMTQAWDFGEGPVGRSGGPIYWLLPYPGEVVSYSYHMPYSLGGSIETFVITDLSNPASPVCADRNPYLDKNAPDTPGDPNGIRSYNSASHFGWGQNVLYKDGHVRFETSPIVGLGGDNIYTYRNSSGEDPSLGTGPSDDGDPLAYPLDETDALLLGEGNGRTR
jgi:type II secretory pathway pseudopilin PulG